MNKDERHSVALQHFNEAVIEERRAVRKRDYAKMFYWGKEAERRRAHALCLMQQEASDDTKSHT